MHALNGTLNGAANPNLRLVQVSGPHGVGKNTMIDALLGAFPHVVCAVPWTTRPMRAGEKPGFTYHYITEADRVRMYDAGEFVNHSAIRSHHSGLQVAELLRAPQMLVDVTPDGARRIKKAVEAWSGRTFCIYLHAPEEHRRARIAMRQPGILQHQIDAMIAGDPVSARIEDHADFDLLLPNRDGEFDAAFQAASAQVARFWSGAL